MSARKTYRIREEMFRRSFSPTQWFVSDESPRGNIFEEERIMWVYREKTAPTSQLGTEFEVGFFTPEKEWVKDSVFSSRREAADRVHYLNGGK
jgi:hypothetical protein